MWSRENVMKDMKSKLLRTRRRPCCMTDDAAQYDATCPALPRRSRSSFTRISTRAFRELGKHVLPPPPFLPTASDLQSKIPRSTLPGK